MNIVITGLTFILVLDCLFLMLLVLVQLPKKEAGMGQAFGGGATDALFGPGSGNALTKLTKYAAGIFLALCLVVSIMNASRASATKSNIQLELQRKAAAAKSATPPVAPMVPPISNALPASITTTPATTAPAPVTPPATNAAAPKSGK